MCGAWAVGRARPGLTVKIAYPPSSSVGQRPKPRNAGRRTAPSGSACQVSISASGTGSPLPSRHAVDPERARRVLGDDVRAVRPRQPDRRYGPTVCDGVVMRRGSSSRRRLARRAARCPTGRPSAHCASVASRSNARPSAAAPAGRGTELKIGSYGRTAGRPGSTSGSPAAGGTPGRTARSGCARAARRWGGCPTGTRPA